MTKAQRTLLEIQGRQSEMRSRLAVLAAQDSRSADEETELTTVETKLSGCEPELRSALAAAAAEDDSARSAVPTTDPETLAKAISSCAQKSGLADFLKARRSAVRLRSLARRASMRPRARSPDRGARADGDFCAHSARSRGAGHHGRRLAVKGAACSPSSRGHRGGAGRHA